MTDFFYSEHKFKSQVSKLISASKTTYFINRILVPTPFFFKILDPNVEDLDTVKLNTLIKIQLPLTPTD